MMYCVLDFFFLMIRRPPRSTRTDTLFPYTTLFRQDMLPGRLQADLVADGGAGSQLGRWAVGGVRVTPAAAIEIPHHVGTEIALVRHRRRVVETHPHRRAIVSEQIGDRKSTRLNSSH